MLGDNLAEIKALAAEFSASARAGKAPRVEHLSVLQHLSVLHELVATQPISICKRYAALPDIPSRRFGSLDSLRMLILRAPESMDGDLGDFPLAMPDENYIVFEAPHSTRMLFVFTGAAHQFGGPIRIMHQWFRGLGVSVTYLFDMDWTYYLGGVKGLSESIDGAGRALRAIAQTAGATASYCIGNSGGGFGALLYAPLVGACRTLALSPPTVIRESLEAVTRKVPQLKEMAKDSGSIDLRGIYERLDEPYRCRILYPQENEHDRAEAMTLTGLAGVEMIPVAGVRNHNLIPYLVSKDRLNAELVWLLDGR